MLRNIPEDLIYFAVEVCSHKLLRNCFPGDFFWIPGIPRGKNNNGSRNKMDYKTKFIIIITSKLLDNDTNLLETHKAGKGTTKYFSFFIIIFPLVCGLPH
jgi:hypothetical protein